MSARKLGRLARLAFVLAAIIAGGVGAAQLGTDHAGAPVTAQVSHGVQSLDWVWE
jgi:hypothetical protein